MPDNTLQLICPECGAINRSPADRLAERPICGKCQAPLIAGKPLDVNTDGLARYIEKSGLPVVVDFWATWCGPCLQFAPAYQEIAKELAQTAVFLKVDTDANRAAMMSHQVRAFPTFILFKDGVENDRITGGLPKPQFIRWVQMALEE